MIETPLPEYLKANSQAKLAADVGLNQTAISKMLRVKRNITVITHHDGKIELREEKTIAKTA